MIVCYMADYSGEISLLKLFKYNKPRLSSLFFPNLPKISASEFIHNDKIQHQATLVINPPKKKTHKTVVFKFSIQ